MAGRWIKKVFKMLTAVVMGGAIGSILGFTLAPHKGSETREIIREKASEMKKPGFFKRLLVKLLTPKK